MLAISSEVALAENGMHVGKLFKLQFRPGSGHQKDIELRICHPVSPGMSRRVLLLAKSRFFLQSPQACQRRAMRSMEECAHLDITIGVDHHEMRRPHVTAERRVVQRVPAKLVGRP